MIRATFELQPPGAADVLETLGGVVVEGDGGRVTVDLPVGDWDADVTLLVAAVVAGEVMELRRLSRCRLVDLEVPDGLLPGPAFGAPREDVIGVIVKPALGLSAAEMGEVARAAVGGGARFLKDDEILSDRVACPLADRVRAVAKALEPGVVYCPNVTGPPLSLLERARTAVDLGATGLLVDPFAQGIGSLLALREAALGVPIFAHRAGSGPWARNPDFGPTGAVLARLLRLCGADYVIAGAFGGTLFETDDEVRANLAAIREPCGTGRPAVAALGGGLGPGDVRAQVDAAGAGGLVVLLGSAAYRWPGGLSAAVAAAGESL